MKTDKTEHDSNTISRRKFLATSAAAAAFTIVKPSQVTGAEANGRIKIGLIGCGQRGSLIASLIKEHPGYQIAAVADYFDFVAQEAGEKFGVPKERCFYNLSAYKKLIASGVDAVFCETPPYCFPEHVAEAVNNNCHVYLAKPVACDVPGCLSVLESGKNATKNNRVFLIDFQVPTEPFNIEVVKRCREGLIGEIGLLASIYTDEAFGDPPKTKTIESRFRNLIWVNDIELGAGMLVNAGIHAIDAALWLAQTNPTSCTGASRTMKENQHGNTADVYSLTYKFDNGLILNHRGEHLRNTHGFTCSATAYGQYGFAEINYEGKAWLRGNRGGYAGGQVENLYVNGIKRNLDVFHKNIIAGDCSNPTAKTGVNSTLTTILGREAAARNINLTWDKMIKENKKLEVDYTGLKV